MRRLRKTMAQMLNRYTAYSKIGGCAIAGLTIPMHTDRREVIGWSLRLSAAGDWERYAAWVMGNGSKSCSLLGKSITIR